MTGSRPGSNLTHVFLNGGFRSQDSQFEEFTVDALGAPKEISPRHLLD